MRQPDRISRKQMLALSFVCLFSPMIRRQPGTMVRQAGGAAYLALIPTFAAMMLLLWFMSVLLRTRRPGHGLGEIVLDALGPVFGRAVLAMYAAWFVYYAGFLLRSGADRFVSTIYPDSRPGVFICVTLLLCIPAALGPLKAIARSSVLFRPLLIVVILLAVLSVTADADLYEAMLVTQADLVPALTASLPLIDTISIVTLLTFLEGKVDGPRSAGGYALWLAVLLGLVGALCLATCATLGPTITGRADYPFFLMVRDLSLGSPLERIEAVIIAVWVLPDFILVATLLSMARGTVNLCLSIPFDRGTGLCLSKKHGLLPHGCWPGLVCTGAALAVALTMARQADALAWYSEALIPKLNLAMVFLLLPLIFAVGRLRKKI